MARCSRTPERARACERERGEADQSEADDRRDCGPVGNERARCEQPDASVADRARRRGERADRDGAEPLGHGDAGDDAGCRNDRESRPHAKTLMPEAVRADVSRMSVDYRLLDRWQRQRETAQFERRIEQAVAYVERRAAAIRALESPRVEPERPRLRVV